MSLQRSNYFLFYLTSKIFKIKELLGLEKVIKNHIFIKSMNILNFYIFFALLKGFVLNENCLFDELSCQKDYVISCKEKVAFIQPFPCLMHQFNATYNKLFIMYKNFRNLPGHILKGMQIGELGLIGNNIETIDDQAFDSSKVTQLDLSDNLIKEIKARIFQNIKGALTHLGLTKNRIEKINGSFDGLTRLVELNLGFNLLKIIQSDSFKDLSSLASLNINNNELIMIEEESFKYNQLTDLNLASNKLSKSNQSSFMKYLGKVWRFLIEDNELSFGGFGEFKNMEWLMEFYISRNNISDIKQVFLSFNSLNNLDSLYISYNQIRTLKNDDFISLQQLVQLHLDHNFIATIENRTFTPLRNLRILKLDNNQITSIDAIDLSSLILLKIFVLKNNLIESIQSEQFKFLIRLETLDLSNNHIKHIGEQLFMKCIKLAGLYMKNNQLSNLNKIGLESMLNLKTFDLSFNQIVSINDTFKKLSLLFKLDLNDNKLEHLRDIGLEELIGLRYLSLEHNSFRSFKNIQINSNELRTVQISLENLSEKQIEELGNTLKPRVNKFLSSLNLVYFKVISLESKEFEMNCSIVLFFLSKNIHLNLANLSQIKEFFQKCDDFKDI